MEKYLSNNSTKICYIILKGGLGNQLFMTFTALNYAFKNKKKLRIIWDTSERKRPKYFDSVLLFLQNKVETEILPSQVYFEHSFSYNPIPITDENIILSGYFQSSMYFRELIDDAINIINVGDYPENKILIDRIETPVILHVRRTDYLALPDYHPVQNLEYYKNGIDIIKKNVSNPHFFLISDDAEFLNTIPLRDDEKTLFIGDEIKTMHLMTLCRYFIIANSSYSWWGAIIGGYNLVVAPKIWFGKDGPQNWQDIYEKDWIII